MAKNKRKQPKVNYDACMSEPVKLRAALLMACTALAGGDPIQGCELAEEFYDASDELLDMLDSQGLKNLPAGLGKDAKVIQFPGT